MGALVISTRHDNEATIVTLRGSASMHDLDALTRETDRLAASRPKFLVLDLSQLDFLASLAIGQLVAMNKSIKLHGGSVALAAPSPDILKVLDRCNLGAIIPIFATVDDALAPR